MGRDNAAVLRQFAGRISTLRDLPHRAQHHADLVGQALAQDDPTSLLSPLADTHAYLKATHAGLAAQVQSDHRPDHADPPRHPRDAVGLITHGGAPDPHPPLSTRPSHAVPRHTTDMPQSMAGGLATAEGVREHRTAPSRSAATHGQPDAEP